MDESKPFLSIIIPVYNVDLYLRQCIDSILNQCLHDYEIILVDDGSFDQSPQICDEYAYNYLEIHVIHQRNGGLSNARNTGIKASRGKYIIFMDSDDWWNSDINAGQIIKIAKSDSTIEMILFSSIDYYEGTGYFERIEHRNLDKIRTDTVEHYYQDLLSNGNLEVAAFTKILNREFVVKNHLYFKNGLVGEDNEWMIRLLRKLNNVYIVNQPLYIYRCKRKGSISSSIKKKNVLDLLDIIKSSIKYCKSEGVDKRIKSLELCYCSYLWFSALGLTLKLPKSDRMDLISEFKATSEVCSYSNSPKTRLAFSVYRIFGVKITMYILGTYIKIRNMAKLNKEKLING